jgi:hypothetical protein
VGYYHDESSLDVSSILLLKPSPDVPYGKVIEYIDVAMGSGVEVIVAVMPPVADGVRMVF